MAAASEELVTFAMPRRVAGLIGALTSVAWCYTRGEQVPAGVRRVVEYFGADEVVQAAARVQCEAMLRAGAEAEGVMIWRGGTP